MASEFQYFYDSKDEVPLGTCPATDYKGICNGEKQDDDAPL